MSAQEQKPVATGQQHSNGPVDQADLEDWTKRFNEVLARPSEHINSKSPEGSQSWFAGFFDCFNPIDTCLITYCLPCVTFGKTHHRIRKNGDLTGYEPINTSCLLFCGTGCFGLHWIPMAMQRQNIREKYNLQGSCLMDIALSCCCHCCTLVQGDKEAEHREGLLSNGAGVQQQYQSNTEMQYPGK
ncbi:Class II DAHP synthetase family protein [Purpureocillium lavendulum]|uniref:Class II DAHP synthetase family protein n=1 Tax=Purpureocillium lavendulum TaxID=1247861 RepID=A0AB34FSV9_9HYPO|nr:Class II DAHP synthetase family protein [Purpureocillium lavendulum]